MGGHYGRPDLEGSVLSALEQAGKSLDALSVADLAPLDNFHTRGRDATLELAALLEIEAGQHVLDVGGGIGGPARLLASRFGCRVTVLDLTEEFVRVGEDLTRRTRLQDRVAFQQGSALQMPFADGCFDRVITQHVSMNIADKAGLYREALRVLRPGGRLALHEITAGPHQPVRLPVPWARQPEGSFLVPQAELRALLRGLGGQELVWSDETGRSSLWFTERVALRRAERERGAPGLGVHLLLGEDFAEMFANQATNLREGRAEVVVGLFERRHPQRS